MKSLEEYNHYKHISDGCSSAQLADLFNYQVMFLICYIDVDYCSVVHFLHNVMEKKAVEK